MDLGHMNVVLKWCICMFVDLEIVDINVTTILMLHPVAIQGFFLSFEREFVCVCFFLFFLFEAATQLARQVQQDRTQVVCSNKVGRSLLALRHSRY